MELTLVTIQERGIAGREPGFCSFFQHRPDLAVTASSEEESERLARESMQRLGEDMFRGLALREAMRGCGRRSDTQLSGRQLYVSSLDVCGVKKAPYSNKVVVDKTAMEAVSVKFRRVQLDAPAMLVAH